VEKRNNYLPGFSVLVVLLFIVCLIGCAGLKETNEPEEKRDDDLKIRKVKRAEEMTKKEAGRARNLAYLNQPAAAPIPHKSVVMGAVSDEVGFNTEEYSRINENEFKNTKQNPISTFSIDVDTASYSNARRFLMNSQKPPKDAIRIEEFINYFTYDYPKPKGKHPFSIITEISGCPWNKSHKLVHIGIQGKNLNYDDLKPSNLILLIDSSGSMSAPNKLPLLKQSLKLMLDELDDRDKIAIVAYAGSAGLVLPSTPASQKEAIIESLNQLHAGGSTAGGQGIKLAYQVAKESLIKNGNNRVILCTDGDFNVGVSSSGDLVRLIEEKRKDDIYLTICGFGMGNYKDSRMEEISNAGNGNYFYIDNIKEARKVFVKEMRATLFTIAKDVKIQVEFNPLKVKAFRLVGYENRKLANEDFDDDKKDAGELGAGHTVTALYELIPTDSDSEEKVKTSGQLKYQESTIKTYAKNTQEAMTIKFRYKPPKLNKSILIETPVTDKDTPLEKTSDNFRFSSAVAGFGMLLRDSAFKGTLTYKDILDMAKGAKGKDKEGYRTEFIELVKTCTLLSQ
jgi:Ca-activated chloride channel family protein